MPVTIDFKTVHRSKGLEADYVIVADMCSGKHGFPSETTDDPILDIVLATPEGHPNAKERRLFYVALIRARAAGSSSWLRVGSLPPLSGSF